MIDIVQNIGLRLTTGAFRSSPISSILNIAGVTPLNIKRTQSLMLLTTRRTQNILKIMKPINNVLVNVRYPYLEIIKNEIQLTPLWISYIFVNIKLSELPKKTPFPLYTNNNSNLFYPIYMTSLKYTPTGQK